jgi:hypothetical protein
MPDPSAKKADVIGWSMMVVLGLALAGVMAYKVNHARERQLVGQSLMNAYMAQHQCVRLARPQQNQPQLIRCSDGETTEHLLRKKVIGDSWK